MAEDILFEQFDLLADTPGGVQKLRELILQLAVQGKLVPQDPEDAPASELLKEIEAEKQRLVKEGKIKKPKALPEIKPEEVPFELPEGWEWVRLGNISEVNGGFAFKSSHYTNDGVRVVRISDFDEKGFKDDNIVRYKFSENLSSFKVEEGNILMAMTGGTVGKSLLVEVLPETMVVNQRVAIIKILGRVIPEYIYSITRTNLVQNIIQTAKNSTNDNISMRDITRFKVSLPPLSEQHRIVAKVDQLMALCDELEAKKEKQKATHARLNKSVLHTLRESRTNDELAANWTRVQDNFRQLFTTPESVQELRSTILQLAVQGKLVPQNPQDEPASDLLERIREEKQRLVKEGKIKKQKPLQEIKPEEVPFELPEGWIACRLEQLITFGPKNGFSPIAVEYKTDKKVLNLSAITKGYFDADCYKYVDVDVSEGSELWLESGDILIQRANSLEYVGVSAIYNGKRKEYIYPDLMMKLRLSNNMYQRYIHYFLLSEQAREYMRKKATGTSGSMPKINQKVVKSLPVYFPSFPEQQCIVAKLDQLMGLCNEMESMLSKSEIDNERLMDSVVSCLSDKNAIADNIIKKSSGNNHPTASTCNRCDRKLREHDHQIEQKRQDTSRQDI